MILLFSSSVIQNISNFIKENKDKILQISDNKCVKDKYLQLKKLITYSMNNISDNEKKLSASKCYNDIKNFCVQNQQEISNIINDLNKIYNVITNSSKKLDTIFKNPLIIIKEELHIDFSINDLHVEEFFNAIINDDFIKALIIEVKQKEIPSFVVLRAIIEKIENEINLGKKVLKKLKEWNDKPTRILIEEYSDNNLGELRYDVKMLNKFLIQAAK